MRMSCNGCRVLRKGCNEGCIIRHCIQWIPNAEAQGNATLFLAKFYGRAGLLNLIAAGPPHLRPEIFKSLLYEACGRIINPINGSVGLQWMNQWHYCEAGVNAVLNGYPIVKLPHDHNTTNAPYAFISLQNCDIRHIPKEPTCNIHDDPIDDGKAKTSVVLIKHDKEDAFASDSNSDFAFEHDKSNGNHQVNNGELPLRDYFREESLETSLDIGVGTSRRRRVKRKLSLSARREVGRELTLGRKP